MTEKELCKKIDISEIFFSVSGEGPDIGLPTIFVRTAGCNLRCTKATAGFECDTKYSYNGTPWSINDVIRKIKSFKCKHITWTGGCPFLQLPAVRIIMKNLGSSYKHDVEANGTIFVDPLLYNFISVSPKRQAVFEKVLLQYKQYKNVFFKFVINTKHDFNFWFVLINKLQLPNERIFMMPEGITDQKLKHTAKWLVEQCKKHNFRLTMRIQIWLWGKKRGT